MYDHLKVLHNSMKNQYNTKSRAKLHTKKKSNNLKNPWDARNT